MIDSLGRRQPDWKTRHRSSNRRDGGIARRGVQGLDARSIARMHVHSKRPGAPGGNSVCCQLSRSQRNHRVLLTRASAVQARLHRHSSHATRTANQRVPQIAKPRSPSVATRDQQQRREYRAGLRLVAV
jgi:hypothetical protein